MINVITGVFRTKREKGEAGSREFISKCKDTKQPYSSRNLRWPCPVGTEHGRMTLSREGSRGQRAGSGRQLCAEGGCKLYPDRVQEPVRNFKQGTGMNRLVISQPW